MKNLVILLIALLTFSCSQKKSNETGNEQEETSISKYDLDWIVGDWKRVNNSPDKETFENWIKKTNAEYIGLGYTLQNADTVFKENMRLLENNSQWILEVTGVNENPTIFEFTDQSANHFVCENENNEFPKKISYSLKVNQLIAMISGGGDQIEFVFEKGKE